MILPAMIRHSRRSVRTAIALSLGLALTGCGGMPTNGLLTSVHQPVVSQTTFTLDLTTGPDGLSAGDMHRLADWFEAMGLRYGDRVAIDDPLASKATRSSVEAVVSRFGLLVSADAPPTPGYVNAGTARIILTRATASVPHCPDWSANSEANWRNASSSNFGCAVNGNLAAMVADPNDLLRGANAPSDTRVMSSDKAIASYRDTPPTGKNGLKQTSSQETK